MEQNKLPKNIRQIGEKEDWVRIYMEDYVYTYLQRLRNLSDHYSTGGVLYGKKQRINGIMHLFIKGAAVVNDPFWNQPDQTLQQVKAENGIYFPEMEICGFFLCDKQYAYSQGETSRIFKEFFAREYEILFQVQEQEETVFAFSKKGITKLAGYYIYYEKNDEMQSYITRQESLQSMEKDRTDPVPESSFTTSAQEAADKGNGRKQSTKAGATPAVGKRAASKAGGVNKEPVRKERANKESVKKGDWLLRVVSIAGIFILAFLLFSDQIKLRESENTPGANEAGLLSSILEGDQVLQAGADAEHVEGTVEGEENQAESEERAASDGSSEQQVASGVNESESAAANAADLPTDDPVNESQSTGSAEGESQSVSAQAAAYVFPMRYLVKKGDSIYGISEKYYGNTDMVDAICMENNISNPSELKYGTVLTLPKQENR